jgi:hypothetical protein
MRRKHTYWLRSLVVLTVTGVPRREPCRPYGRAVSPERELQLLSVDPWRAAVSFLVMVTDKTHGERDAMRRRRTGGCLRVVGCLRREA